jgi:hypothetical protein
MKNNSLNDFRGCYGGIVWFGGYWIVLRNLIKIGGGFVITYIIN